MNEIEIGLRIITLNRSCYINVHLKLTTYVIYLTTNK
jgi:hypothetical protein